MFYKSSSYEENFLYIFFYIEMLCSWFNFQFLYLYMLPLSYLAWWLIYKIPFIEYQINRYYLSINHSFFFFCFSQISPTFSTLNVLLFHLKMMFYSFILYVSTFMLWQFPFNRLDKKKVAPVWVGKSIFHFLQIHEEAILEANPI